MFSVFVSAMFPAKLRSSSESWSEAKPLVSVRLGRAGNAHGFSTWSHLEVCNEAEKLDEARREKKVDDCRPRCYEKSHEGMTK
jgi:hypothetical protein